MASWIKYILIISAIIGVLVFTIFAGLKNQANVTSTQEVDIGLTTTNVGEVRDNLNNIMNREEAVAEMILEVATTQKNHKGDTLVEYVFLDSDGEPTDDEKRIESIQFVVKLLDSKNNVQSVSTERIEINKLGGF